MTQPELHVTAECRAVRNKVGPTAWVLVEELALAARQGRSLEVATTVRDLGVAVGLSKDTVASALQRLMTHGVVTRVEQRDRRSGCFGSSIYRLHLTGTGLTPITPESPNPDPDSSGTASAGPGAGPEPAPKIRRILTKPDSTPAGVRGTAVSAGQMSLLDDQRQGGQNR